MFPVKSCLFGVERAVKMLTGLLGLDLLLAYPFSLKVCVAYLQFFGLTCLHLGPVLQDYFGLGNSIWLGKRGMCTAHCFVQIFFLLQGALTC